MALTGALLRRSKVGSPLTAAFSIVASGTYPTGGDTLDFGLLVGYTNRQPSVVQIQGIAGFIYQYDSVNKKMLVYCNTAGGANAALGEHTNVAYVAGILADTIRAECIWITTPQLP